MRYKPMLATLTDSAFDDPDWLFEVKWDGYRVIAECARGGVKLWSRGGLDITRTYAPVAEALADMETDCVLDGELVALDPKGRSRFELLQEYGERPAPLAYYVFDLLAEGRKDLRDLPLVRRKERLEEVLRTNRIVRYSEPFSEYGVRYFTAAARQGLEGIVAKKRDSRYYSGKRTKEWLKIKAEQEQETVIVGYTAPKGSRKYLGSLVMALRTKSGWKYVGRAGGIGGTKIKELYDKLRPLRTEKRPFAEKVPGEKEITWVKPKLVGEVRFTEWTKGSEMRHPVFLGLRTDKKPAEVTYEHAIHPSR